MLDFITPTWSAVLLIIGVLGLVFRNQLANKIAKVNPFFPAQTTLMIFIVLALVTGGIGGVTNLFNSVTGSVASIGSSDDGVVALEGVNAYGTLSVKIADGYGNSTITTDDYYNDANTIMTSYKADASQNDGEEFGFNLTILRTSISEDASIPISCSIPDKALAGVVLENIAEKTSGKIDLDYVNTNDNTGTHVSDTEVSTSVSMAEGVASVVVEVKFDSEETYLDGMTDFDDYADVNCVIGNNGKVTILSRYYTNG